MNEVSEDSVQRGNAGRDSFVPTGPSTYHEQIVASMTSGVMCVDKSGTVVTVNPAARRILGLDLESLFPGSPLEKTRGLHTFAELLGELSMTLEPVSRREFEQQTPRGKRILGATCSLLEGPETFNGVIFVFSDITMVRELERAATLNRQLAQIGELTAGVVHELRNPLSVITGMAELLTRGLESDPKLHGRANTIVEEAVHLEKLISKFLSFAKPFDVERSPCAPISLVARATQLCDRLATERGVTMRRSCSDNLPPIFVDQSKMSQAISNLIRNAIEAMKGGGTVMVSVRPDDDAVSFTVSDTGPGIHLEEGEDLFSPFFSKKADGTGLGLSIVHRIVSAHGGTVRFENRDEGGAAFIVSVPTAEPASAV